VPEALCDFDLRPSVARRRERDPPGIGRKVAEAEPSAGRRDADQMFRRERENIDLAHAAPHTLEGDLRAVGRP